MSLTFSYHSGTFTVHFIHFREASKSKRDIFITLDFQVAGFQLHFRNVIVQGKKNHPKEKFCLSHMLCTMYTYDAFVAGYRCTNLIYEWQSHQNASLNVFSVFFSSVAYGSVHYLPCVTPVRLFKKLSFLFLLENSLYLGICTLKLRAIIKFENHFDGTYSLFFRRIQPVGWKIKRRKAILHWQCIPALHTCCKFVWKSVEKRNSELNKIPKKMFRNWIFGLKKCSQ